LASITERFRREDAVPGMLETQTPFPGPAYPLISSPLVVLLRTVAEEIAMDSGDRCRANLVECRELLPSAQNDAEATVLKTLVRSWKMIANQLDRHAELMDARAVRN
jgi:hypothetical protein